MTRDEAIEIWQFTGLRPISDALRRVMRESDDADVVIDKMAEAEVDAFVALGLLKLDEPKSAENLAIDALSKDVDGFQLTRLGAAAVIDRLTSAGLKIVEK